MGMFICPTTTPTRRTEVTVPSENVLYFSLPIRKPRPIVRNIGMDGYVLNVSKNHCNMTESF